MLFSGAAPRQAILKAERVGVFLASRETLAELLNVFRRPKFDRAAHPALRESLYMEYARRCIVTPVHSTIRACRDPKDDKFLELAVDGRADLMVSGDQDLLALHPFRGIPILTPTQFLEQS
jgi:putative PIN family toxin of toxin-antitoxin system